MLLPSSGYNLDFGPEYGYSMFFRTSVKFYQSTLRHIPEDSIPFSHQISHNFQNLLFLAPSLDLLIHPLPLLFLFFFFGLATVALCKDEYFVILPPFFLALFVSFIIQPFSL
jgi:hypothetical protein